MNILQVISSSRTSGAEKHFVVLSESLMRRGHNVLAVCPPGGWVAEQLHTAGVPSVEVTMHGMASPGAVLRLRGLACSEHMDVIHTHLTRATYLGYFAGALSRIPVISTVHVLTRDMAYRYLPNKNHWLVAVSDFLRQGLIAKGIPADHVRTVYNGTEFVDDEIRPASSLSVRAELGLPADAKLVGIFGRVDAFKGHHILVRAARAIVDKHPRTYFVIVGLAAPGIHQRLWEMASAEGVEDRLRFTGVRDDVSRLMEAMDVVTVLSQVETFGMVVIEAMAVGKPVIATRVGAIPELVADGVSGVLIDRTPAALAAAMNSLLADPDKAARMGVVAKSRAAAMFSARTMAQNMENLYRGVLAVSHRG